MGLGIVENKMETTIIYWGSMGIMESKKETTIVGYDGMKRDACNPHEWFRVQEFRILGF